MQNSLPFAQHGRDNMRLKPGTLQGDLQPVHPVQLIQKNHDRNQYETKKTMLAKVYGVHVPLRQSIEETILSRFQRGGGLKSSLVGLETVLGEDTEIRFEDYLGDPAMSTETVDAFAAMEARFDGVPVHKR